MKSYCDAMISLCFSLALLLAAYPSAGMAAIPSTSKIQSDIIQQLKSRKIASDFTAVTSSWESRFGTRAFEPLLRIAKDRTIADADRTIALMSAAKIGGAASMGRFIGFLGDKSWMLRSAALRTVRAFGTQPGVAKSISETDQAKLLKLLKDTALVIRAEAVDTLLDLHRSGMPRTSLTGLHLKGVLKDERNYRAGQRTGEPKAELWVPARARRALSLLKIR